VIECAATARVGTLRAITFSANGNSFTVNSRINQQPTRLDDPPQRQNTYRLHVGLRRAAGHQRAPRIDARPIKIPRDGHDLFIPRCSEHIGSRRAPRRLPPRSGRLVTGPRYRSLQESNDIGMACTTDLETSCCFQADLGRLSEAAESRWRTWASRKCCNFLLEPQEGGEWILHARRDVESDARTLQKLLRTLGSHWKMKVQTKAGRNWLRLITEDMFAHALRSGSNPEREDVSEPASSEKAPGCAGDYESNVAPELPPCSGAAPCRILLQLSSDFDARAQHMHAALQACR
jgi:hypothetical protein